MPIELTDFTDLVDLASERVGGAALLCSDDFFAGMENLVKPSEAVWDEHRYTDRGKWMDGWESRRSHRENHVADGSERAHEDWCIVRLGAPGRIRGLVVDTAHFKGNFPAHAALEGISVDHVADGYPRAEQIRDRTDWVPVLPKSALAGNSKNRFVVDGPAAALRFTHVRLRIFPDGGVARLRVFGEPLADWRVWGGLGNPELELSSALLGGLVVSCSDMFFGSRHNLLFPGDSGGMHDGWETRRARRPGFDWAVIRLGAAGLASRVVVDTAHFKGNCPESFALDAAAGPARGDDDAAWAPLVPRTELRAHTRHVFLVPPSSSTTPATHVRLRVFPDGGVARFRLFGTVPEAARGVERVRRLDAMPESELRRVLTSCCGSTAWVQAVAARRPFSSWANLEAAADAAFTSLREADWLEAFAAHPKIGDQKPAASATSTSAAWSSAEQRQVGGAPPEVHARLAEGNAAYLAKFGFLYIVKATGKSAEEMLALLEQRLHNDRTTEVHNAAAEQRKITSLRLARVE